MKSKKMFVVSDVHGHYTLLREALDRAGFDKDNEDHLLICCGDYFDRGNENVEVLRFFERLQHKVLLRGNHGPTVETIANRQGTTSSLHKWHNAHIGKLFWQIRY